MGFKQNSLVHVLAFLSVLCSGLVISVCQMILFVFVHTFSKQWYRRLNYYLCYSFYGQTLFLADWWAGVEMEIYIDKEDYDKYYGKEHGICVMNHTYEIDWILGYMFCNSIHTLGNCKAYIKKALQYIPIIGWIWYFGGMVLLARSFDKDEKTIRKQITEIVDYPSPGWLLIFPEGTRLTEKKYEASVKYAKEKGLPILKHHLVPRTKGFVTSLKPETGKFGGLYDITLTFKKDDKYEPTMLNLVKGRKLKAYLYIKRIPFEEVPTEEEAAGKYLMDIFVQKDKIQESFHNTGDYFAESGVKRVTNIIHLSGDPYILANFVIWATINASLWLYFIARCIISGHYMIVVYTAIFLFIMFILFKMLLQYSKIKTTKKN